MRNNKVNDEMANFYTNSSIYRNWIAQHQTENSTGKFGMINTIELEAYLLLNQINYELKDNYKIKNTYLIEKYGGPLKVFDLEGKYLDVSDSTSFTVSKKNGLVFYDDKLIFKYKNDTLSTYKHKNLILVAKRDNNKKVEGLYYVYLKDSTKNKYAKKIK